MPSIGPLELGIVLLIVLLIFGPKRLPGLGRQIGSGLREFKDSISGKDRDDDDDHDEPDAFGRRQQLEAAETRPVEAAETRPVEAAQDRPASRVEQ
jgi:sec-independent protein translocase protein TatA